MGGIDPLLTRKGASGRNRLPTSRTAALVASALCGTAFGFVLQKGHVYEPAVVRGQMLLARWGLLELFLAGAAVSALVFAAVALLVPGGCAALACARAWAYAGRRGPVAAALGGMALGAGMALAGACPGTVLVQVGTGVRGSALTAVGALCGALAYALLEPGVLVRAGVLRGSSGPVAATASSSSSLSLRPTWDALLGVPFPAAAAVLAAGLGGAAWALVRRVGAGAGAGAVSLALDAPAWPAWEAGVAAGMLQAPMLLVAHETLGTSRAFVTVVANVLAYLFPEHVRRNSCLAAAQHGTANHAQALFVFCTCVGAFLSCVLAGTARTAAVAGVAPLSGLAGGFLAVFGARLAGGCPAGMGLSGNGLLVVNALIATVFMFVGGIPVAKFAQVNGF